MHFNVAMIYLSSASTNTLTDAFFYFYLYRSSILPTHCHKKRLRQLTTPKEYLLSEYI